MVVRVNRGAGCFVAGVKLYCAQFSKLEIHSLGPCVSWLVCALQSVKVDVESALRSVRAF